MFPVNVQYTTCLNIVIDSPTLSVAGHAYVIASSSQWLAVVCHPARNYHQHEIDGASKSCQSQIAQSDLVLPQDHMTQYPWVFLHRFAEGTKTSRCAFRYYRPYQRGDKRRGEFVPCAEHPSAYSNLQYARTGIENVLSQLLPEALAQRRKSVDRVPQPRCSCTWLDALPC